MSVSIRILVGTMTGTAQLVAEEIQYTLTSAGLAASVLPMDHAKCTDLTDGSMIVVCTSTYGSGDVPDNARAFYNQMLAERPSLSEVRYALFGLGDSTYADTYNFGGKKFRTTLDELGAKSVIDAHFHNASGGTLPEEECVAWAEQLARSAAAAP